MSDDKRKEVPQMAVYARPSKRAILVNEKSLKDTKAVKEKEMFMKQCQEMFKKFNKTKEDK